MENFIKRIFAISILYFGFADMAGFAQLPRTALLQKGGSIGISIGVGYNLFNDKGTLDFTYGFVPRSKGGLLHIIGAKLAYRPIPVNINNFATVYPVNPGAFFTYHLGKKFSVFRDRDQFPKGYYWWPTALRAHLSFSNEISFNAPQAFNTTAIRSASLYSEVNANDLYLVSWVQNPKGLSLRDIFKTGYGLRVSY